MSNAERKVLLSPAAADGMNITGTDSACFDLNVDIIVTEWLWFELILVEFSPCVRSIDLEDSEGVWINHYDIMKKINVQRGQIVYRF